MADELGAVRRTPRPTGDRQTPETAPQESAGTTNTASPVSGDQPAVSSRVSSQGDPAFEAATLQYEAALAELRAELRAKLLADDPNSLVIAIPDNDAENFVELPDCTACDGTGKDDHGTVFEAPLAVHFAGPPVEIAGRRRQLCMWCGHVLRDSPRAGNNAMQPWPVGALVRIEDGIGTLAPHEPGAELPPGCCALPDDDMPTPGPGCYPPADGWDGVAIPATCGKHVPGTSSNRCLLRPGHTGDCSDEFEPAPSPWICPNTPPCEHPAMAHDVSGDPEDPKPMCCTDGCRCGQPDDGPGEAQETRAAADWPAEEDR